MTASFRSNIFDPILVVCQIIAMQCFFYVSLGFWMVLANLLAGLTYSVDQFFDYHEFEGSHDGWLVMGAVVLSAFTCALGLRIIVKRAKLCLDFTVTVYVLHLLACVCYTGIPHSWAWWLCNIIAMVIMAVLGEYLCMRSELAAIPVGGTQGKGGSQEKIHCQSLR